jgi:hypothetical protein
MKGSTSLAPPLRRLTQLAKVFCFFFSKKKFSFSFFLTILVGSTPIKNAGLLLCTAAWYRAGD